MLVKKYNSIQILRGFAAVFVLLYHATRHYQEQNLTFLNGFFQHGYFGVDLFFVISGFVIPYTMFKSQYQYKDAGTFMLRRLARIEPPYWCSIALIFLTEYISTFFRFYKDKVIAFSWKDLFYHIFHLNDFLDKPWLRGIYWSLAIEVQFYLLMAILFPYLVFKNKILSYMSINSLDRDEWEAVY